MSEDDNARVWESGVGVGTRPPIKLEDEVMVEKELDFGPLSRENRERVREIYKEHGEENLDPQDVLIIRETEQATRLRACLIELAHLRSQRERNYPQVLVVTHWLIFPTGIKDVDALSISKKGVIIMKEQEPESKTHHTPDALIFSKPKEVSDSYYKKARSYLIRHANRIFTDVGMQQIPQYKKDREL